MISIHAYESNTHCSKSQIFFYGSHFILHHPLSSSPNCFPLVLCPPLFYPPAPPRAKSAAGTATKTASFRNLVGQPPGLGIWRFRHTSHSPKPQNSSSRSICIVALQIMALGFAIGVFGVLILFHAAYSTIQYRGLLKITEEEFSGPPFNVVTELSLGLVLCMWAALTVPGKFLSIHPDSEENRIVSLPANLDFMIFNHRGKVFPVEMDLKLKQ
ncbi:hypothetical protein Ahy_B06g082437 isoform B [Arachis hypogaea]|uniref:Membrane magnesium transporter n=1 Tax=Arachis hypogaea TaxID=3818 RepID=A0A444YNH8_ARAHY|nr:hypothetical protein Ahy_B06g082437 isoform B [Arachis hypogaea]